jgi:hypothetical protein
MKAYGGEDAYELSHIFLNSALVGNVWSGSRSGSFTLGERAPPRYPFDRRLDGPQNRSGGHGEKKNIAPTVTRTPTPRSSSP